ncbi:MAG: orotate phosphoribosyltransferase [Planctomycetota bacterium]|nr:MAG: orotate phosphoribosyltransferase [Planctomycetota bacterium]
MNRNELARAIYETAHLTGTFTLRSGTVSHEYFDKYLFEANPKLLKAIAEGMAEQVPSGIDALAGLEMGGIPLVTMLSQITGLPALFVRKQAKQYGTAKLAEGGEVEGRKLLVVEDVITSGGQVVISTGDMRKLGATIEQCVCVIDRQAGGREALAEGGIALSSLFTMSELKEAGASAQA